MKNIIYPLLFIAFLISSCNDDNDTIEEIDDLNYISLEIAQDSIMSGEEVQVTATATGSQLAYHWSATKGDILGSGATVVYASSPCHVGTNTITCKITNGDTQEETKTVDVVVLE